MENHTTNAAIIADPETHVSSSSSSASNNDLDRKGRSSFTATRLALALSISTFLIGLILFFYSSRKNVAITEQPALLFDRNETEAYFLRLQSEVLSPSQQQQVLILNSPVWKALQWMTLQDPLRPLPSGWQATQRYAMVALFYHWTGDSAWDLLEQDGWIQESQRHRHAPVTKKHECEWKGVECDSHKKVTSLLLDSEQTTFVLNGQMPSELGLLTSLSTLDVTGHMLKGVFPPELASLGPSLKSLNVAFNRFTSLDAELMGQLTSLEILHLSNNLLRGTLPTSMMNLNKLRVLDLENNDALAGNALVMMSAWPNLKELDVTNTQIGGSIPDQIGDLSSLELLDLGFSPTTGSIPTSIGKCTALKAMSFAYPTGDGNGIHGTIPTELGHLTNLQVLSLPGNHNLDSTIPSQAIGTMSSLSLLDLAENDKIHGTIPTQLGLLSSTLQHLRISQTSLTGTLPTQLVALTNLKTLQIHGTAIHGKAPDGFCQLSSLQELDVACTTLDQPQLGDCSCCECIGY